MNDAADYLPDPSELDDAERQFLRLVAPLGLDFLTTRQQYLSRYGGSRYHDWADTVTLPASRSLSDDALSFHMYADPALLDLPPEYLFADFMPTDDARHNHALIEQQLSVRLGPPSITDSSNTLGREWRFGVFRVVLTTFPPELQDRRLTNSLHQKEPRLAFSAGVRLHADYCCPYPDASLQSVAAQWPAACRLLDKSEAQARLVASRQKTRRNPASLSHVIPAAGLVVWHDAERGRVGVSARERSLVASRGRASNLTLWRLRGRGGERASLSVNFADGARSLDLLDASGCDSLDVAAGVVSELWQLPLVEQAGDSD